MKINLLLICALVSVSVVTFSQDSLVFIDGTSEMVKIEKVTHKEISYRKVNAPNGPEYVVPVNRLHYYVVAGGERVNLTEAYDFKVKKNYVSVNPLTFLNATFSGSYERMMGPMKNVSLYVPVAVNINQHRWGSFPGVMKFETGVGALFYAHNGYRARIYGGPSVTYGLRSSAAYAPYYVYDPYGYSYNQGYESTQTQINTLTYALTLGAKLMIGSGAGLYSSASLGILDDLGGVRTSSVGKFELGFFYNF